MKLPLALYIIYLGYSLSQDIEEPAKKIIVKSYPKKVHHGFYQINDSGKYIKPQPTKIKNDLGYTVFSKVFPNVDTNGEEHLQIVPDSPYFPVETPIPGQQIRVKKVLTENGVRHKRAVDENAGTAKKTKTPTLQSGKQRGGKRLKRGSKKRKLHSSAKKKRELVQGDADNKNGTKVEAMKKHHPHHHHHRKPKRGQRKHRHSAGRNKKNRTVTNQQKKLNEPRENLNEPQKKASQPQSGAKVRSRSSRSRKENARRLIAGRDAMIEQYPYVVSIQRSGQHWCAGALLNPRIVVTTANCMWRSKRVSKMRVRAGSRHTDRGGQTARIQEVMKHPNWKIRKYPDNDVAMILLDRHIKFSHSVHGVDLPNRVMMPAFDDAWITSWGSERRDGEYDPQGLSLQVYHARFMDNEKCNNVTQRFGVSVTENFFCLAQTGRRAPCTRDTGAPAVSDGVLWGLASWGIRKSCGTERFPAVFSYLASHSNMDFISNATYKLMSDERQYPFPDRYPRSDVVIGPTNSDDRLVQ